MDARRQDVVGGTLAILADIHGNLAALDAVLEELDRREVSNLVVAGDILFGGDEPLGVWRRLQERRARLVRGLSDTALATLDVDRLVPSNEKEEAQRARFLRTRREVGELVLHALGKLPEHLRLPLSDGRELLVCHGSPGDAAVEISFDVDDEEMLALLGGDPADIVAVAGSHVPFERRLDQVHVVGLGSVGEAPEGTHAHFVLVTPRFEGTLIEQAAVELAVLPSVR